MKNNSMAVEGTVAFSCLTSPDVYQGKETGWYHLVLNLPEDTAETLKKKGVKVKDYEGSLHRKFKTKSSRIPMFDETEEGNPVEWLSGEIPRGSRVRILAGFPDTADDKWGLSTYLNRVKILEVAEQAELADF